MDSRPAADAMLTICPECLSIIPGSTSRHISIVDVSNPASPQVLGTFGASDLNQGGTNLVQLAGNELVVTSQNPSNANAFNLLIYSLADPRHPALVSNTTIPYRFAQGLVVEGTTAYVATDGIQFDASGSISKQFGDVLAIDISQPAAPHVAGLLFNDQAAPDGHNTNEHDFVPINSQLAYVADSTSTGIPT